GVVPHALVGCSVGALNGAYVAQNPTLEATFELENHWCHLSTRDVFPGNRRTFAGNLLRRRPYLHPTPGLQRLARTWLPDVDRLEDLSVPLRVVTTHLGNGSADYHDTGDLERLLLATAALPGVFPPVDLPDRVTGSPVPHVDGGIADMVPVAGALN